METRLLLDWYPRGTCFRGLGKLRGSLICFSGSEAVPLHPWAKLALGPYIDLKKPKRWLSDCEQSHEECHFSSEDEDWPRPYTLRVIDVEARCVVDASQECRYAALSYVWGSPKDGRLVLNRNNLPILSIPGSLNSSSRIPTTILDAMRFLQLTGERFLWVDSLCLVQDDDQELQQCLTFMDKIYKQAVFTAIAASVSDAYAGLPGIYPTKREVTYPTASVAPGVQMIAITADCATALANSQYASRAWTMQEELCSRRRFYFIDDQIYFRCNEGAYNEVMTLPNEKLYTCPSDLSTLSPLSCIFAGDDDFGDPHFGFVLSMENYLSRRMTNDSDILRAATGMLNELSSIYEVQFCEGLSPPFELSILFHNRTACHMSSRRLDFPSYSWTGWNYAADWRVTKFSFGFRYLKEAGEWDGYDLKRSKWVVWHARSPDGILFELDTNGKRLTRSVRTPPGPKSYQQPLPEHLPSFPVSQAINTLRISEKNPEFTTQGIQYPFTLLCFWTVCIRLNLRKAVGFPSLGQQRFSTEYEAVGKNESICGVVCLDSDDVSMSETHDFALICEFVDEKWKKWWCYGLLLKWNGAVAERRGIIQLTKECLSSSLGVEWRAIILG